MSLIKCTECGKEFSDRAPACPNCACPTSEILDDYENEELEFEIDTDDLFEIANDVDELLKKYKFLTYDEMCHYLNIDCYSEESSFFSWYVQDEDDDEFNNYYTLYKRRQEIVKVNEYYTLKSIKNEYENLSVEKVNEIRNSIPLMENDARLKEITIIDLLINIANESGPEYIYNNSFNYSIDDGETISNLGWYSDGGNDYYFMSPDFTEFNDKILVNINYNNLNNIDNVDYPTNIEKGNTIRIIDLFVLAAKNKKMPKKIHFINKNEEDFDYEYLINEDFDSTVDSIGKIFGDEFIDYDELYLNDKIEILE